MVQGPRLSGVVIFVRELDRSVNFYRELLELEVVDSSTTAALLAAKDGCHLVLRATGATQRPLGAIGVQYATWMMPSRADLERVETMLKDRSAYVDTQVNGSTTAVEGRDPDDLSVVLTYSSDDQTPLRELPSRIYAW